MLKQKQIKTLLIANRGEIACRVAKTARRMGIRTIAVFSEADQFALHVRSCDEAYYLGPSAAKDSYLRADLILKIAKEHHVDAIHPGYGFLSENETFAQQCADNHILFVGPPPNAIRAMGLKAQSKQLMEAAHVPLVPGYHGDNQDDSFLQQQANQIGYPLLIKASAGGGGKGMRVVEEANRFLESLQSCRREALANFANEDVLLERYLKKPRHVEIQIFADQHGNYVHLFERDCSVQRRHQKVLEEAPAPHLSDKVREGLAKAAISAAKAVGYVGAGTVEFIVEKDQFYFMEMNTRLQVEHPVTEMITGLDLVEWQLRVVAGEVLPKQQNEIKRNGHAIEARLCAERPDKGFLPATGWLNRFRLPTHEVSLFDTAYPIRIDSGVEEGGEISPFYDSMIAKVIAHGQNREQALAKLSQTLAKIELVGVETNLLFLQQLLNILAFQQADLDTGLIPKHETVLFSPKPVLTERQCVLVLAYFLVQRSLQRHSASHAAEPWNTLLGFRNQLPVEMEWEVFPLDDEKSSEDSDTKQKNDVSSVMKNDMKKGKLIRVKQDWHNNQLRHFLKIENGDWVLSEMNLEQDLEDTGKEKITVMLGQNRWSGCVVSVSDVEKNDGTPVVFRIFDGVESRDIALQNFFWKQLSDGLAKVSGHVSTKGGGLTATMPGKIVSWHIKAGQAVKVGEPMVVIEAMKMEHTLKVPFDGKVKEIFYQVGEQILEGVQLVDLDRSSV